MPNYATSKILKHVCNTYDPNKYQSEISRCIDLKRIIKAFEEAIQLMEKVEDQKKKQFKRKNFGWGKKEVEILISTVAKKGDIDELAKRLERSPNSIRNKMSELNLIDSDSRFQWHTK